MIAFGIFIMILGALFVGNMAGLQCYLLDHVQLERTHHRNPDYSTLLNEYEIIGAVLGALPGALLILFGRHQKANG